MKITTRLDLPARSSIEAPGSRHQPNPQRPSNPFVPSSEPDWILVPKAAASQGRRGQGNPEISSTGTTRHSPAPLAPPGSLRLVSAPGDDSPSTSNRASITRTASLASSVSSSTSVKRKSAPPVPKKPELLGRKSQPKERGGQVRDDLCPSDARISSPILTPQPRLVSPSASTLSSPPSFRQSVDPSQAILSNRYAPTLPPPRRSGVPPPNLVDEGGPPLPPRRPSRLVVTHGDIMDESVDGALSIPSLQPRRT